MYFFKQGLLRTNPSSTFSKWAHPSLRGHLRSLWHLHPHEDLPAPPQPAHHRPTPQGHAHLGVNPLHVGLEVPLLRKGGRTEGTGVGLLTRMLNHVSLQRSLLIKSFSTFATLKWPFTWRGRKMIKIRFCTVWAFDGLREILLKLPKLKTAHLPPPGRPPPCGRRPTLPPSPKHRKGAARPRQAVGKPRPRSRPEGSRAQSGPEARQGSSRSQCAPHLCVSGHAASAGSASGRSFRSAGRSMWSCSCRRSCCMTWCRPPWDPGGKARVSGGPSVPTASKPARALRRDQLHTQERGSSRLPSPQLPPCALALPAPAPTSSLAASWRLGRNLQPRLSHLQNGDHSNILAWRVVC